MAFVPFMAVAALPAVLGIGLPDVAVAVEDHLGIGFRRITAKEIAYKVHGLVGIGKVTWCQSW